MSGSLWSWAVDVYGRREVAEAALDLQDHHGQSIAYLLWAAWAGGAAPEVLARGAGLAREWEVTILQPVRTLRRSLKAGAPWLAASARRSLRDQIQALELDCERSLLTALEALGPRIGAAAIPEAVRSATVYWGPPPPDAALLRLTSALS